MKIQLLVLFLIAPIFLSAQTDQEKIEATLNNYLIGGTERDAARVVSAFHEEAKMQYITDEGMKIVNAQEFFGKGKPGPKVDRQTHIVDVKIMGTAAQAYLRIDYPEFSFHDYMQLLKEDGEWLIVSKIFYREMKKSDN